MLPENEDAVEIFFECSTQWRAGIGGVIGLDYPAVFQVAEALNIPITREVMAKIQHLERRTLDSVAQKKKEKTLKGKNALKVGHSRKRPRIRKK
ncbi:MAG: DUF1799 domain-containing protein [Deltaproteobacteria bacterium]|nr:DUF1799 domain-containing protein [Deltaproteobacteria bacterium]